jgi:hypothetical protein
MGSENTGIPWSKGYVDLERGRPMFPVSGTGRVRITDSYGNTINLGDVSSLLEEQNRILSAVLLVLNSISGVNISKEDID